MIATAPVLLETEHQSLTLPNVSWPTYQALLRDMGDHRAARLSFSHGNLQIKMPSQFHEIINRLLARIVTTLTEELGLEILDLGSTTLQQESLQQGVEPDTCFYIQNAGQLQGVNPVIPAGLPPDLVIEVDITSPSTQRMKIYQQLGVPEVWRYTQKQGVVIYKLQESNYQKTTYSLAFPFLSADKLNELIKSRQTQSENTVMRSLRRWLQGLQADPESI
jgi:Uma2 family endonuclease